ncbi:MAG: hypothetical protein Q7S79_00930 [bacterium]|nr:hypothetical protein [bacterium]
MPKRSMTARTAQHYQEKNVLKAKKIKAAVKRGMKEYAETFRRLAGA